MLFEVNSESATLEPVSDTWTVAELELERYLISTQEEGVPTLNYSVFNEELLIVNNQVRTKTKKRADILALDKMGNAVIIELKRDHGSLGVDTQALQYLADFSRYKGLAFLDRFLGRGLTREDVFGFLGDEVSFDDMNKNSRIILIARSFDATLFSMGEWLSSKGVGFRCITYHPTEIDNRRFISFSVCFDRSPESLYPLLSSSRSRMPRIFWHNIGYPDDEWWSYIKEEGALTTSFECRPGDQGERILKSYIPGDRIVAYVKGRGAVGWGKIGKDPISSYRLFKPGSQEDIRSGSHLHRIPVQWFCTAESVQDAIAASRIRDEFGIYHPVSTSTGIGRAKGELLLAELEKKFGRNA
jgi:hypothetical protein